MRNISTPTAVAQPLPNTSLGKKRVICQLDEYLLTKAKTFLTSQHLASNYQVSNFSDLVRQSLTNYQKNKSPLPARNLSNPRKSVGFLLDEKSYRIYQNFPVGHRTEILERCLVGYLNTI